MQSLTCPQQKNNLPQKADYNHTLMLGTSAGIRNIHNPCALPFDTVTYLLRANAERERMNHATGLFFAFDRRMNGDTTDQADIQKRTERLRQIIGALLPHFVMTTHSELEEQGLASTLEQVQPCAEIENEELRNYTRIQTAQVLHMYAKACNNSGHCFTKFGWILSRRGNGTPVGGEVNFDQLLPRDIPIERIYTSPAFPLDSVNGKAPYLLNESDRAVRVCLPNHQDDVGMEVQKVQSGITRLMYETLKATAETVLNIRASIHLPEDELVTLPITQRMKQRVTDEQELSTLRELLSTSLHKLLP